ncbi:hypothetical protein EVAR_19384_1 [Eumeta japonica]|uniref:Uncharacterized protein n=1 Tax=Eumeta variegata TaxID=151549 RepID=A0A4C1TRJ2_EUMVA|nr:hypothetical protein EVAR_19384_1 [Eumeta japonica]
MHQTPRLHGNTTHIRRISCPPRSYSVYLLDSKRRLALFIKKSTLERALRRWPLKYKIPRRGDRELILLRPDVPSLRAVNRDFYVWSASFLRRHRRAAMMKFQFSLPPVDPSLRSRSISHAKTPPNPGRLAPIVAPKLSFSEENSTSFCSTLSVKTFFESPTKARPGCE